MSEPTQTIVGLLDSWFGGAATTLIGAILGRAMWHTSEVKKGRRKLFGKEALWEIPIAGGMNLIGLGLAEYWGLSLVGTVAVVTVLAYYGPKGTEVLFIRWFGSKMDK